MTIYLSVKKKPPFSNARQSRSQSHMPFSQDRDTEPDTEQTRSSVSWCWPKGTWALGTRLNARALITHKIMRNRDAQCNSGEWRENFLTLIFSDNFTIEGESPTSFRREHARKNSKIWANRASLAMKATVAASPKILQLELWREMFSSKYGLSGPIKRI